MNIQSAVIEGTNILKNKSILSAQLDTEILMAKALGKNREYIILNHDKVLNIENLEYFKKLVQERATRKPIAYLLKKKFFWKSEFCVNKNTLIPRPDTEIIVEQILKVTKHKSYLRILDIGIGSGCILLTILKERKSFYGTGIDISKNSIKISKINAKKLFVDERVKFYKSDVDKFAQGKYDLIVSNPPYIKKSDLKYLESDVLKFEPKLALDGGLDGLSVIRKVIKKSSELLKKNGKFILEIGFNQKSKVIKLLNNKGFYINSTVKDLAKNDRCIVSTKI
ncbi:peptide chain release factor N(5)-glutamine methyltransferase [Candidatus Pelagibacter bacterium nBUS_27]|uniref:peptide chain release factor N(5)-glutamine methyltransferase n=1 Tax=Candidatus Pelagibacter bacterium nBUS_27 TaxID=3374188 RepID=UPI003EBE7BE2